MKHYKTFLSYGVIAGILAAGPLLAAPLNTAFTYQGRLDQNGQPPTGLYQMTFWLYTASSGGSPLASNGIPIVGVTNGLFTTDVDFGANQFTGDERWLAITVATNGSSTGTLLQPRTRIAPIPYALHATTAGIAGSVSNNTILATSLVTTGAPPAAGQVLSYDGSSLTWQGLAALSGAWSVNGNSTTPGQFLGTTGALPLDVRVNNARALRLEPNTYCPNVIGGWNGNVADGGVAGVTIAGGGASPSFFGVGASNRVTDHFGTIGGGAYNLVGNTNNNFNDSYFATIAGGYHNVANGIIATISGGSENRALANDTFVGGGFQNTAQLNRDTVAGGALNVAGGGSSTVGGGVQNSTTGFGAIVGGGELNSAEGTHSVIAGGYVNRATGAQAAIGGGDSHEAFGDNSTIAGGIANHTEGFASTIGGGRFNRATTNYATVGGGNTNWAQALFDTVSGGGGNRTFPPSLGSPLAANSIGGGYRNIVYDHARGVIGGGEGNSLVGLNGGFGPGFGGTVPGGVNNTAGGNYSFAAGRRAKAVHNGSFVWGDSTDADIASTNANTVTFRAVGGYLLYSGPSVGVFLGPNGTSWGALSDRNAKKNLAPVNHREILGKLAKVPVQQWLYKAEADDAVPHLGPMAQDFKAAFYSGRDDKIITTLEFDGVELAAIQGLNEVVAEKEARIARLELEMAALKNQIAAQEHTLARWETRFAAFEQTAARAPQPALAQSTVSDRSAVASK